MKNVKCDLDAPFVILTAAVLAGVAFLVTYQIGRPLWMDDTHSTFHAFHGPLAVIQSLRTDSHPPLYFLLLSVWMALAGLGEVALRIPSVIFYLLTGLALFLWGRKAGDTRLGLLVATFLLFHPTAVRHAHGVRMYALLGLLAAVSTILFLHLAHRDRPANRSVLVAFTVTNVLGTFTHYWFFFLMAGQAAGATVFAGSAARIRLLLSLLVSAMPFAVLWTPVLLEQMQGNPTSWMEVPGGFWLASAPLELLGGQAPWNYWGLARVFYLLLVVVCLVRVHPGRLGLVRREELVALFLSHRARLLTMIPVTVMTLALVVSQYKPVYNVAYTIVTVPPFAMLLALILFRLGDRKLVPFLALAFLGASCMVRDDALQSEYRRDDRASTQFLIQHYEPGDEIVHISLNYATTTHYLRALAPDRWFPQSVFPGAVARHPGWRDVREMARDTLALQREATALAQSLRSRPELGRVWLLAVLPDGIRSELRPDSIFTGILLAELEREFVLEESIPFRGWWHSEIRLYTPRGPDQGEGQEEEGA